MSAPERDDFDVAFLRDLDGTGSMHVCSREDDGATEFVPGEVYDALAADHARLKEANKRLSAFLQMSRLNGAWDTHPDCADVDAALGDTHA